VSSYTTRQVVIHMYGELDTSYDYDLWYTTIIKASDPCDPMINWSINVVG